MTSNGYGAIVESRVPGRVRFRFPRQQRSADLVQEAASILGGIEGVLDVTSNPYTGSLLVLNDPDVLDVDGLVDLAREAQILDGAASKEIEPQPGTTELARSIHKGFKRFDKLVCRLTNGTIDGKMLIIFLLLGAGLTRALLGRKQSPAPWYALLWYGYSAFMQWHKPGANEH